MLSRWKFFFLWAISISTIVAFVIYFVTIIGFTLSIASRPKIKLTKKEKNMVKQLEVGCDCDVVLDHNYELINGDRAYAHESLDSFFCITFKSYKKDVQESPFCNLSDSLLAEHAKKTMKIAMRVIEYKSRYRYVYVFYRIQNLYDKRSGLCYREVLLKTIDSNNFQLICVNNYNE